VLIDPVATARQPLFVCLPQITGLAQRLEIFIRGGSASRKRNDVVDMCVEATAQACAAPSAREGIPFDDPHALPSGPWCAVSGVAVGGAAGLVRRGGADYAGFRNHAANRRALDGEGSRHG
jgi:hypothetical protein